LAPEILLYKEVSDSGDYPTPMYGEQTIVTKLQEHISHLKLHTFY
jgi:hypothetical protein